jgi:hypothetical protein
VIDVGAIPQEHISKGAPVLVLAVGLEDDIFSEGNVKRRAFALHLLGESMQGVTHIAAVTTTRGQIMLAKQVKRS